jgi:hypothetical protein
MDSVSLDGLSRRRLRVMRAAGDEILDAYGALARGRTNLLLDFMRGMGPFVASAPYPPETVVDTAARFSYLYHSHRDGEHGHFHTYLLHGEGAPPTPHQPYAHVVAIEMDDTGIPTKLFTTNRWVTGETLAPARTVIAALDEMGVDHAWPSWLTNRWMTAMLRLFRPQIEALLLERDAALARHRAAAATDVDCLEDRSFEVCSSIAVSIDAQLADVDRALDRHRRG